MATNQDNIPLQYFLKNNDNSDILIIIMYQNYGNYLKTSFFYYWLKTIKIVDFM